jgi:3-oxoacyl-[acyl-carrier-protein] synthase-3
MRRSTIIGTGAYLPEKIMFNADLPAHLETSHEWIMERTGIEQRHIAAAGEYTSDLGVAAGKQAIQNAGITPETIDFVILATATPDDTMPATATKIQHRLGITNGAAFDINAACSGFIYAMSMADSLIKSGAANRILIIGAETYSRILNWDDRGTCILFGDGAAAVLLDAQEGERGILFSKIHSDGKYSDLIKTTGGVCTTGNSGLFTMEGKEVFRHAASKMPAAVEEALQAMNMKKEEIDWLVPHQANMRILKTVAQKLEISEEKVISNVAKCANTSAASIPLALHQAANDGRIKREQIIACPALGAGLTWGCTIIRW